MHIFIFTTEAKDKRATKTIMKKSSRQTDFYNLSLNRTNTSNILFLVILPDVYLQSQNNPTDHCL